MKRKHSYERYFNAIGAFAAANPTPLNKAIWGLMKHCRLEIVQTQHSDSIEYVGRRMDAKALQDALYNLFEKHVCLKQELISSNKKIKIWHVADVSIPQETGSALIKLHDNLTKQAAEDNRAKQMQKEKYDQFFSK